MTNTTNYALNKPGENDYVEISVINGNMDILDMELKKAENHKNDTAVHVSEVQKTAWNAKETPAGAQSKANQAKTEAINTAAQDAALKANAAEANAKAASIPLTQKGAANGVAETDENGIVLSLHLPSYVDDVLEYAGKAAFPAAGETGKIYVDLATNLCWRWSGSVYVEISPSVALGETASTAYRGDRGKAAYEHSQTTGNPHNTTAAEVGARPDTWMPTAAQVGAVPTSRTINGKPLTSNITLTAEDVGAGLVSGVYTGDGQAQRTVPLGFTPRIVMAGSRALGFGTSRTFSDSKNLGCIALTGFPALTDFSREDSLPTVKIVENGFTVYYTDGKQATNYSGFLYFYVAWR